MDNSKCRGCGQLINWIKMKSGKMMPVDPQQMTVITSEGQAVRGFIPHWSTCPNFKDFKKKQNDDKRINK